jgi:hypothetical protein
MIAYDKRSSTPYDEVIENIDAILSIDNPYIILGLTGGEIMMHPRFNDIVDHVYKTKKPETKIALFTHADHKPQFFKDRLESLKKFGDQAKVQCSVHFEELDTPRFKSNVKYVNDNFKWVTLYTIISDTLIKNLDLLDDLFEENPRMRMYCLFLDQADERIYYKQIANFKKLDKYTDRMDNIVTIHGEEFKQNIGSIELLKRFRHNFSGRYCTMLSFDVKANGNVHMPCNGKFLFNVKNGNKDNFAFKKFECTTKKCLMNMANLLVEDE